MTCPKCQHAEPLKFGTYGVQKIQRYRCRDCGATFSTPPPKPLGPHTTSLDDAARVFALLVEGMSIRAVSRITGIHKNTILALLETVGAKSAALFDARVRNVRCRRVQCDEIWSFVGAKQKHVPEEKRDVWGDWWTWTAIDADTKLIVAFLVGHRGPSNCYDFMKDLASRILTRHVQLSTDGLPWYIDAVDHAFGVDVHFGMIQKYYGKGGVADASAATRYSPAKFMSQTKEVIRGNPDPKHISTSYVERQNLTMRMSMRRFTRLTNGFSKSREHHAAMVSFYFAFYNFVRVHETLRITPAMAAGLTDRVWSVRDLLTAA